MNTFYIPGELMSLNEFINIQRTHPMKGNQVKQKNTNRCKRAVLEAIQQGLSFELPVRLSITWYMKNRRKDPDNIAFAVKFILDGLVNAGALPNDGWNEIVAFRSRCETAKSRSIALFKRNRRSDCVGGTAKTNRWDT
ncbi:hypothetical protein ACKO7J_002246 [Enterococcus hirae]